MAVLTNATPNAKLFAFQFLAIVPSRLPLFQVALMKIPFDKNNKKREVRRWKMEVNYLLASNF
jgi:hypothetical protein